MKKFDLSGKEIGHVSVDDESLQRGANSQMIKDYIIAIRANARQWSANTKTRPEVQHSGQKPHPQKGTGKARQGYLGATQYKGGGRVGGPRPKFDQHVSINRKEKRAAVRHLIAEKIQEEQVIVLNHETLKKAHTKKLADFLKGRAIFGKKVLFVAETAKNESFLRSMRNIPGAAFILIENISGYDIAAHRNVIILEPAVDQLLKMLEG